MICNHGIGIGLSISIDSICTEDILSMVLATVLGTARIHILIIHKISIPVCFEV